MARAAGSLRGLASRAASQEERPGCRGGRRPGVSGPAVTRGNGEGGKARLAGRFRGAESSQRDPKVSDVPCVDAEERLPPWSAPCEEQAQRPATDRRTPGRMPRGARFALWELEGGTVGPSGNAGRASGAGVLLQRRGSSRSPQAGPRGAWRRVPSASSACAVPRRVASRISCLGTQRRRAVSSDRSLSSLLRPCHQSRQPTAASLKRLRSRGRESC